MPEITDTELEAKLAELGYGSGEKGPQPPQWLINRAMNLLTEESSQTPDSEAPQDIITQSAAAPREGKANESQDVVNQNAVPYPEPSQMSATLLDDGEPEENAHPRDEVWGDRPTGEFPPIAPVKTAATEETDAASSRPSVPSINFLANRIKQVHQESNERAERQKVALQALASHIEDLDAEQKIRYRNVIASLDTHDDLSQKAIDLAEDVSKRLDELKDLLFSRAAQKGTIEE